MKIPHYKTTMELPEFEALLVAAGYKQIGSGCWSVVYGKENVVCKVGEANSKGYLSFVEQAIQHSENPHLPKIYAAGVFHIRRFTYFVVYMERLTESHNMPTSVVDSWFRKHNLEDAWDFECPHVLTKYSRTKALKELADILAMLYKKYDSDMENFNLMWRTNGVKKPELVITDPVWR